MRVIATAAMFATAASAARAETKYERVETPLAEMPNCAPGCVKNVWFSRDGRHVRAVIRDGDQFYVQVDGHRTETFDQLIAYPWRWIDAATFTDGPIIARRGDRYFFVRGTAATEITNGYVDTPHGVWSPCPANSWDGGRLAYCIRENGKYFVVLDGDKWGPFDRIFQFHFSQSGKRFAFVAQRGGIDRLFVDGREVAAEPSLAPAETPKQWSYLLEDIDPAERAGGESPTGQRYVYGKLKKGADGREQAYEVGIAPASRIAPTLLLPEGSRYAYTSSVNGEGFVVLDGARSGPYELSLHPSAGPFFSPRGERFGFIAGKPHTEGKFVLVDGVEHGPYPHTLPFSGPFWPFLTFSENGKRWAYLAWNPVRAAGQRGEDFYVIDGVREPAFSRARNLVFSQDGDHYAYFGITESPDRKTFLVRDGQATAIDGTFDHRTLLRFSPDGRRLVYEFFTVRDKVSSYWLVVDDQKLGPFEASLWRFDFSRDGKHFAFITNDGIDYKIFIDGKLAFIEGRTDAESYIDGDTFHFDDVGRLVFVKRYKDGRAVRVEATAAAG